jgi:hypothetical protein
MSTLRQQDQGFKQALAKFGRAFLDATRIEQFTAWLARACGRRER